MRHLTILTALGASLLAGVAFQDVVLEDGKRQGKKKGGQGGRQGYEIPSYVTDLTPEFYFDDREFRVDCDNWQTVRPSDREYWERISAFPLNIGECADVARKSMEKREYTDVRISWADFRMLGKPFVKIEAFGKTTDTKSGEEEVHRWHLSVGPRAKVKTMMRVERFPGTPVRGEIETLDSGVMVHDVRVGDGQAVDANSTVRCHYIMTCLDGSLVLDTYADREPLIFDMQDPPVEGFATGLIGARVGGKRKIIVPQALAFGREGLETDTTILVPPFATVSFDIEVLHVR